MIQVNCIQESYLIVSFTKRKGHRFLMFIVDSQTSKFLLDNDTPHISKVRYCCSGHLIYILTM